MTDIELENLAALTLLRAIRDAGRPIDPYQLPTFGSVSRYLLPHLEERGLIIRRMGGLVTTSAEADRLLAEIDAAGARMLAEFEPCPYTFSHTRSWCGNPFCRES